VDTNILPVDKAVDNLLDKVWSAGARPVERSPCSGLAMRGRLLRKPGKMMPAAGCA